MSNDEISPNNETEKEPSATRRHGRLSEFGNSALFRYSSFVICHFSTVFGHARQDDAKGRSLIYPCLILQHAAVLFDNPGGNRQAQSGAASLGREEWIEQPLFYFGCYALAGVRDFQ